MNLKSEYNDLFEAMYELPDYSPIFLNDLAPDDLFERRKCINKLELTLNIFVYTGIFNVRYAVQCRELRHEHPDSKYVAVSTGVRGHNHSLVIGTSSNLQALDHDLHVAGIIPSLAFFPHIPKEACALH